MAYFGSFVCVLAPGEDGPRAVLVRFRDQAGNLSDALTDTIAYDTTPPSAPRLRQPSNPVVDAFWAIFSFLVPSSDPYADGATDHLDHYEVIGGPYREWTRLPRGADPFRVELAPDTTVALRARAVDRAGNASTPSNEVYLGERSSIALSAGPAVQQWPRLSGQRVVWYQYDPAGNRLGVFDLDALTEAVRYIDLGSYITVLALAGERVAFGADADISLYDLASDTLTPITSDGALIWDSLLALDGDRLAWVRQRDSGGPQWIQVLDLGDGSSYRIEPGATSISSLSISGDLVAWTECHELADYYANTSDVRLHDHATGQILDIAIGPVFREGADIDGDFLVWEEGDPLHAQVAVFGCRYNRVAATCPPEQLSAAGLHRQPAVRGNRVVWLTNIGGLMHLTLYDRRSGLSRAVTAGGYIDRPEIEGDWIVYADLGKGNGDIWATSVRHETFITDGPENQEAVAISGSHLAWSYYTPGVYVGSGLLHYDLESQVQREVTTLSGLPLSRYQFDLLGEHLITLSSQGNRGLFSFELQSGALQALPNTDILGLADGDMVALAGGRAVYLDYTPAVGWRGLFSYDLTTHQEALIASLPGTGGPLSLRAHGSDLVWSTRSTANDDVWLHELASGLTTRITTDAAFQGFPDLDDDAIVWEDERDAAEDSNIYLYERASGLERKLCCTGSTLAQVRPTISGCWVAFMEGERNSWQSMDIVLLNWCTGQRIQVTSDQVEQSLPEVDGDTVVWRDLRSGYVDLWLYAIP